MKNEDTWKRIVQAAQVRSYRPVTDLAESHGTGMPPEFNYHRECYQMFTHKKTLNKIKNSLTLEKEKDLREEEDLNDLINSCNGYLSNIQMPEKQTSTVQLRSSFETPSSTSTTSNTLLPDLCIFCNRKVKYVKRNQEPLRMCQVKSTQLTLEKCATEKEDFQMLSLLATRNLCSAFGKYHPSCYQEYTRPKSGTNKSDPVMEAYKRIELEALHLVIKKCHEMICQQNILKMQELTCIMSEHLRVNGISISNSTKKNLRRNIESTFGDKITFLNVSSVLFLYPSNITTEKIFKVLYTSQDDDQVIIDCAKLIRKEITDMKEEIPWPPEPEDLEPDAFHIPRQLERFLLYLFGNKSSEDASNQNARYQHSMAQDLIYTVTAGRVKTPKSLLLQCVVKSLTNNAEIITILNRLGHGVSYSTLSEMLTENAYKIADQQAFADVILPDTLAKVLFAIYVADNIDRNEETLSGNFAHSSILGHLEFFSSGLLSILSFSIPVLCLCIF